VLGAGRSLRWSGAIARQPFPDFISAEVISTVPRPMKTAPHAPHDQKIANAFEGMGFDAEILTTPGAMFGTFDADGKPLAMKVEGEKIVPDADEPTPQHLRAADAFTRELHRNLGDMRQTDRDLQPNRGCQIRSRHQGRAARPGHRNGQRRRCSSPTRGSPSDDSDPAQGWASDRHLKISGAVA
jgi:hypothetical protein